MRGNEIDCCNEPFSRPLVAWLRQSCPTLFTVVLFTTHSSSNKRLANSSIVGDFLGGH